MNNDMKCSIKCPICGEILQKYGEVDPDTGTSIVLGANCPKCGIGDSDIKLWQELIRTRKALEWARHFLKEIRLRYLIEKDEPSRQNKWADTALYMYNLTEDFFDYYDKTNETKGGENDGTRNE